MTDTDIPKENKSKPSKMGFFYSFFCWCSGARLYILKQCPSEYNKFFGMGAVVFMTGVMASITGSYALYTVFNNVWIAAGFGIFWGFLIFALDWYIVASLKKEEKFIRELGSAVPRLMLAVLIAFVISKPLELKLFEKEIDKHLVLTNELKKKEFKTTLDENFAEIKQLEEENRQYQEQINRKEEKRDQLFDMIIAEAEGRSPTSQVGKGPVYREKKAGFDKAEAELAVIRERNNRLVEENNSRISQLKKRKDLQVTQEGNVYQSKGFLGKLNALSSLASENRAIKLANIFIILLFIVIESAPMIVKLISRRGPYDILLEAIEKEKELETRDYSNEIQLKYQGKSQLITELKNHYFTSKLAVEKENLENAFDVKREIDKDKLQKWQERENEKLAESSDVVLKPLDDILSHNHKIISE